MNLKNLIQSGESQTLDFKYCVSDSRKIARTLCAFSNSDGGKLLIGVRDNGAIAGIKTEEEFYMIETAAAIYCKPEVKVSVRQHKVEGKTVLEVDVPKGADRPYKARDEDGNWKIWFRKDDKNLLSNRIITGLWKRSESDKGALIKFGKEERILLNFLKNEDNISFAGFRKIASLPSYKAEKILINLLYAGVIEMVSTRSGYRYRLCRSEDKNSTG
jgi:predicted HTH transcriptional regulator